MLCDHESMCFFLEASVATACGGGFASIDLVQATIEHVGSELGVIVDRVIVRFNPIGVIHGELRILRCLNCFVNNAVPDAERIEVERIAFHGPVLDLRILFIEVVEEGWTVVTTVTYTRQSQQRPWARAMDLRCSTRITYFL